jgi:hypothetical protein
MSNVNNTPASNYFAIVSPCSSCNNQRSVPDTVNKLPACPRRAAIAYQQELQNAGLSSVQADPLALTGNEDVTSTSSTGLVNPVYSSALNTVLVWIAAVSDNIPTTDSQGNVLNPALLSPGFDTNYINCRSNPVTPSDNESVYRSKGAWAEGDQLTVQLTGTQQTIPTDSGPVSILLEGFANKVNFAYSSPRVPLARDYSVGGS